MKCKHNNLSLVDDKYQCQDCGEIITHRNGRKLATKAGARFCSKHGAYGFLNNPFEDCNLCYAEKRKRKIRK